MLQPSGRHFQETSSGFVSESHSVFRRLKEHSRLFPQPIPEIQASYLQVQHLVEEARNTATSLQHSVSKALTGQSKEGFTLGMRSPMPSYAPQPRYVQFLRSGAALDRKALSMFLHGDLLLHVPKSSTMIDQEHGTGPNILMDATHIPHMSCMMLHLPFHRHPSPLRTLWWVQGWGMR